jgi:hypothetical protein
LGNSAAIVASVVQIAVSDDETMNNLAEAGHTAKYEVVQDLSENSGPVLLVTVDDVNASESEGTRDALLREISERLKLLQDSRAVPADLRVTTLTLTSSTEPTLVHKKQIRFGVVAGSGALAVFVGLILVLERRSDRRRLSGATVKEERREPPSLVERADVRRSVAGAQAHRSTPDSRDI